MLRSEDIYSRWLERVRTDSTLVIDGVGRLNNKSFMADPTFIALFNNSNGRPVKVKRKRGKGLLIVVILLILVMLVGGVVGGAYWFFNDDIKALINKTTEQKEVTRNTPVEVEVEDTTTVTEYTDSGASKEVERKLFPGYVLIKMIVTDDSWYVVRNIRGCTGFVGPASKPVPLTDEEVAALGVEKHSVEVGYSEGDNVKIISGPLEGYSGTVKTVDTENNSVCVVLSMFGRETPVELELDQISIDNE